MTDALRTRELAAIHTAKRQLGLEDDAYRDLLERVAGKRSAGELDARQRQAVIEELRRRGFSRPRSKPARPPADRPQARAAAAWWWNAWQLGVVEDGSVRALDSFVRRQTGKGALSWCTPADINSVIEALRAMCERSGFAPADRSSPAVYHALMRAQWQRLIGLGVMRTGPFADLGAWLRRYGVAAPHFLDAGRAKAACEALGRWLRDEQARRREKTR